MSTADATPQIVRVVRGSADADELAAVVAVLHALAARGDSAPDSPPAPRPRAGWSHHSRRPPARTWRAAPPGARA
ncbi:acyl-CoA carboxylase subunit epsilon [Streptomyces sp. NPDC006552]|uniref:acyl-CoA carboxylase subunit epsilon n=1 Tax=Streptomyces sp. NPDC006552 TaxID=3157179 RepID=UPI0033B40D3D